MGRKEVARERKEDRRKKERVSVTDDRCWPEDCWSNVLRQFSSQKFHV